jgi:hypothetical protein
MLCRCSNQRVHFLEMAPHDSPDSHPLKLVGVRVLVVEDEYIADDLTRAPNAAGASVVGPIPMMSEAHGALDDDAFEPSIDWREF